MRLFIIGNGFDIDHNIKSKFKDFKEYLEQTYLPTFNREYVVFPNVGAGRYGEDVVDSNSAAQILYALLSNVPASSDWRDFEECLGELDYQAILDLVEEDEENPFRYYNNLEDIVSALDKTMVFNISQLFCEWVEEIDISKVKHKYAFKNDDLFLTFNYTSVLEDVYGISNNNICHIHGSCKEKFCITGHGDDNRSFDDYDEFCFFEIEHIHRFLRKRVEKLYDENYSFFEGVYDSDITEIVFFGVSLKSIDLYYIKKLFENIHSKDINLFFSSHEDKKERNIKLSTLYNIGFKGKYLGAFNNKLNME